MTRVPFRSFSAVLLVASFRNRLDSATDTAELMQATDAAHDFDRQFNQADRSAFWAATEEQCA